MSNASLRKARMDWLKSHEHLFDRFSCHEITTKMLKLGLANNISRNGLNKAVCTFASKLRARDQI